MAKIIKTKTFIKFTAVAIRSEKQIIIVGTNLPTTPLREGEKREGSIRSLLTKAEVLLGSAPKGKYEVLVFAISASLKEGGEVNTKTLVFKRGKLVEMWEGGFPQADTIRLSKDAIESLKANGITRWQKSDNLKRLSDTEIFKGLELQDFPAE